MASSATVEPKPRSGPVRSALERLISSGEIEADPLQRRLAELGHSYQSLVDEARCEVALRLVAEGRQSLVEVAFLTGFSEQSSFTRAFKRWSGTTPRSFREQSPRLPIGMIRPSAAMGGRYGADE